jgi:hypothetical protein
MHHNHQSVIQVALDHTVTEELTRTLRGARRSLTRAPSDRRALVIGKEISREHPRTRPVEAIALVLFTAQADGAPQEDVEAFPLALLAALRARRSLEVPDLYAALDLASDEETRAEKEADCLQHLLSRDRSLGALRRGLDHLLCQRAKLDWLIEIVQRLIFATQHAAKVA